MRKHLFNFLALPQTKLKRPGGFTLIELLVAIAILGVLGTFAFISFRGSQAAARDSRRQSDLRQYQAALEVYANRSNSFYPVRASTVNITTDLCSTLSLTNCPADPQASASFFYRYQSNSSGSSYVLWAQLERPDSTGTAELFVLCSNGKVGKVPASTTISGGACPASL